MQVTARYDGHADWYDGWAQSAGAEVMAVARAALGELLPAAPGPVVDIGCGTGVHAELMRDRGFRVVGLDYSADQLRLARDRLPVARADARALPLRSGSVRLVFSMFTHTDLDGFDLLVAEAARVLEPGGALVYVGVHPCFVSPFAERMSDGVRLHPGYKTVGWQARTAHTGTAVRHRVGVHHLSLEALVDALLHPEMRLDRLIERGGGAVPEVIAVRVSRRP
jgi:SAM-dependent methyltransferase